MSTPDEAFSRKKPYVSHFRIFGSSFYYHVSKEARKNLEPTSELGIFVGYIDIPHNYRVYLLYNFLYKSANSLISCRNFTYRSN